jgi:hypothetical protein
MADALPPNWNKYTTDDGKDYFHNSVTNTTQWERPEAGLVPSSLSFASGTSEVYEYRPTTADLEVNNRAAATANAIASAHQQVDDNTVSLHQAPGGRLPNNNGPMSAGMSFSAGEPSAPSYSSGIMGNMLAAASQEEGSAGFDGMAGAALAYAQTFFDVTQGDVIKRLRMALVPIPHPVGGDHVNDFRARPDFWGPFWITTTAVLFLSATGNFARLMATDDTNGFKADYGLVNFAASMLYGCLIGVPLITRIILYFSSEQALSVQQMICVYGYSLTPLIPVSILCLIPVKFLQWLAILAGLGVSLAFINTNLWAELAVDAPSLRWKMIGLGGVAQVSIFFVYRWHFF